MVTVTESLRLEGKDLHIQPYFQMYFLVFRSGFTGRNTRAPPGSQSGPPHPQMLPGRESRGLWRILTGLSRPLKLSILPAEVHRGSQQSLDGLCWQRMKFAGFSLDPEQVALIRGKFLGFGGNLPHWFASPLPQGCHFIGVRSPNCRVMRT